MRRGTLITLIVLLLVLAVVAVIQISIATGDRPRYPGPTSPGELPQPSPTD
ncbi:MAG: hypothetical protein M3245_01445 [Actinomycetota bacterium]|nr:hypothetical protein [Actinomycetota bacterium]